MSMSRDRRSPFTSRDDGPPAVVCRVCFRSVILDPEHVFRVTEFGESYWAFRCPECGGSFPVRDDDAPPSASADAT
jgi:predicted RNA-binding Zn-ribbon protein involved in translation (DUF1610 family)